MKYKDWLCEWLELYVKPTAKDRTYKKYRMQIKNHMMPVLGSYDLCELSARVLQKFTAELTENGYAANTVNGVVSADTIIRPRGTEKRIDIFTRNEQRKIESYDTSNDRG